MQRLGQLALAGALGVTLCSCAEQPQARTQAQIATASADADAQCRSYGATPRTPVYDECKASVEAAIARGKSNMWMGDARTMNKEAGF